MCVLTGILLLYSVHFGDDNVGSLDITPPSSHVIRAYMNLHVLENGQ